MPVSSKVNRFVRDLGDPDGVTFTATAGGPTVPLRTPSFRIPGRAVGWVDNTCSVCQTRDRGHLIVREFYFENLQVFAQLLHVQGARDGDDTLLLHKPPQRNLGDAQLLSLGDLLEGRVVQNRPAGER
jgi:hypothetical protein